MLTKLTAEICSALSFIQCIPSEYRWLKLLSIAEKQSLLRACFAHINSIKNTTDLSRAQQILFETNSKCNHLLIIVHTSASIVNKWYEYFYHVIAGSGLPLARHANVTESFSMTVSSMSRLVNAGDRVFSTQSSHMQQQSIHKQVVLTN